MFESRDSELVTTEEAEDIHRKMGFNILLDYIQLSRYFLRYGKANVGNIIKNSSY